MVTMGRLKFASSYPFSWYRHLWIAFIFIFIYCIDGIFGGARCALSNRETYSSSSSKNSKYSPLMLLRREQQPGYGPNDEDRNMNKRQYPSSSDADGSSDRDALAYIEDQAVRNSPRYNHSFSGNNNFRNFSNSYPEDRYSDDLAYSPSRFEKPKDRRDDYDDRFPRNDSYNAPYESRREENESRYPKRAGDRNFVRYSDYDRPSSRLNDTGRFGDRYNSSYRRPEKVKDYGPDLDREYPNRRDDYRDDRYGNSSYRRPERPRSRNQSLDDGDDRYPDRPAKLRLPDPLDNPLDSGYSNRSSRMRDSDSYSDSRGSRYDKPQFGYDYSRHNSRPGNFSRENGRNGARGLKGEKGQSSCPIQTKETKSSNADIPTTSASAILSTPIGDFILYCSQYPAKTVLAYPLYCTGDEGIGKEAIYTVIEESCHDIRVVDDLHNLLEPQHLVITLVKGAHSAAYQVDYQSGSIRLLPCLHIFEFKYLTDVETVLMGEEGSMIAFSNNNIDPSAEPHERFAPIYMAKSGQIGLCGFAEITETTEVTSWKKSSNTVMLVYSQRRGHSRRYILHLFEVRLFAGQCYVKRFKSQKTIGGAPYKGQKNTLCASEPFTIDQCLCGVEDLQILRGNQKDNAAHLALGISNNIAEENYVGCPAEEQLTPENERDSGFCCCPWTAQRSFLVAYSFLTNSFDHLDKSPVAVQQLYGGPASVTGITTLQTEQCCPVFQTVSPVGSTEMYTMEYNSLGQLQVYQFVDHGLPPFVERSSYGYCEDNDIILSYTLHSFQSENTIYHLRCNKDGKYTFDSYKLHKDKYAKNIEPPKKVQRHLPYGNSTYNGTSSSYLRPETYKPLSLNRTQPVIPYIAPIATDYNTILPLRPAPQNRTSLYSSLPYIPPNYASPSSPYSSYVNTYQEVKSEAGPPYSSGFSPYQSASAPGPGLGVYSNSLPADRERLGMYANNNNVLVGNRTMRSGTSSLRYQDPLRLYR